MSQVTTLFDKERVEHQVAYLGLLENVRVPSSWICTSDPVTNVLYRGTKCCRGKTWPNPRSGDMKGATNALLRNRHCQWYVVYGKTKIFIRTPKSLFKLEKVHERNYKLSKIFFSWNKFSYKKRLFYFNRVAPEHDSSIVTFLQKMWRGYLAAVL